jgi:asparagine synthetase B (glutamine-hydrolysing)
VAGVPVGIFLSGGMDSTALLALASAVNSAETRALTMAMPGSQDDELALAADHGAFRCSPRRVRGGRAFGEACLPSALAPWINQASTA